MPSVPIKVTVLGSGTSMGVPSLGCHCRVCTSKDPHDNRLRPSLLLSRNGQNVVIDTTPDFRQQALKVDMDRLDAILLTHSHADHILGFDDIRPFNMRQKSALPVYSTEETFTVLRRAFAYVFDDAPVLSTIPSVTLNVVDGPFELLGVPFIPVPLLHGPLQVLGFRFGRAAYLTDFSSVPDSSLPLLEDLDELVVDALRDIPHPMHQTVEQALALIERLKPRRAWFTHIAHDLPHAETNERLRKLGLPHVQLAYDGLQFDVSVENSPQSHLHVSSRGRSLPQGSRASSVISQTTDTRNVSAEPLEVFSSAQQWSAHYGPSKRGSVLAIGNFDGIHLGHQAILSAAVHRGRETNAVATVLTFDPLPPKVLRPQSAPPRLSTNAQRLEWFQAAGLEAAVVLPFTLKLAEFSPQDFADDILTDALSAKSVMVGENFRFGHRQAGDVKLLRELGMSRGFEVVVIPPIMRNSKVVSSTVIRREIAAGNVLHAGRLLGRPFVLTGEIVSGTATGRHLTFPTLNLAPEQEILPAQGVYVTRTVLEGETKSRRSITNIGYRPTFNGSSLTIETYLLDHSGDISAKRMELHFWKRLRAEQKFATPEDLRAQIASDIARAHRFFVLLRRFRTLALPTAVKA